jgi:uncharacterized linocin/CFP29 family protein
MMNRLYRDAAPMSERAWQLVDDEAARSLRHFLAARHFVDVSPEAGWDLVAVPTGRVGREVKLASDVDSRLRDAQPALELRTTFRLPRDVLAAIERGGQPDLTSVVDAMRRMAEAEDCAVFHGADELGLEGILHATPHEALEIDPDYRRYPATVAEAVQRLRSAGVGGPYGIAVGPRCYTGLLETTDKGHPIIRHIELVLDGPIVPAPVVDGAVVMSVRGGDFELVPGSDFAVGYESNGDQGVMLFVDEVIAFRVVTPEAAIGLQYLD